MKKKGIFWRVYAVCVLLALLPIGAVWYMLYDFLTVYEAAQPVYKMDDVMSMFTRKDIDAILACTVDTYSEEMRGDVETSVRTRLGNSKIAYTKAYGAGGDDAPAYSVYDEKGEICTVYLKAEDERGKYDAKIWALDRIENLVHRLEPVDIIAPENYIVKINGKEATPYATTGELLYGELGELEEFELIHSYTDFPTVYLYRVDELYVEPEVTCYTPDGSVELEPNPDAPARTYQFDAVYYETIPEERAEEIKDFTVKYVNYVMRDEEASEVLAYAIPGTVTYTRLKAIEKMNVWTPKHTAVQFSEMEFSDYRTYSDCLFSCKLHFTYMVPYRMGDSEYETDLIFYYLLTDGKWKIAEMIIE